MAKEHDLRLSRRSGTGALVLLTLLLVGIILWRLLPVLLRPREAPESARLQSAWEQFRKEHITEAAPEEEGVSGYRPQTEATAAIVVKLAAFDPNTATEPQLLRLGLPLRTVRTMLKYRSKGGRFRKPEDLQKLYTLSREDYTRIASYVHIAGDRPAMEEARHSWSATKQKSIELNTADAAALMALRGIGAGYSRRILNFRNALGGFVRVEQLQEVYGFPDSTYQQLKDRFTVDLHAVKLLNINTATEEELGRHPYIGRKAAAGIIKLRNERKSFTDLEQIRQVSLINDEKYRKIAPYLSTH